jgi:hypothetical protein
MNPRFQFSRSILVAKAIAVVLTIVVTACLGTKQIWRWRNEPRNERILHAEAIRRIETLQKELDEANAELKALRPIDIIGSRDPLVGTLVCPEDFPVAGWIKGKPTWSRVVVLDLWTYT